jgi:hypothetical protein
MPRLTCRPHLLGQLGVGADADGHHDQVGRDFGAVLELDRRHAAVGAAHQFLRLRAHQELQAALLQRLLQQLAGDVVQLALHQPGHDVHHGDVHAAQHQAVGRFQAQQAAADDDGLLVLGGGLDHRVGVGDVAVGDDALQVLAGHRQDEGVGAGAQQQPVVRLLGAVLGAHHALDAVDLRPPSCRRAAGCRSPRTTPRSSGRSRRASARRPAPATAGCGCSWGAARRRRRRCRTARERS